MMNSIVMRCAGGGFFPAGLAVVCVTLILLVIFRKSEYLKHVVVLGVAGVVLMLLGLVSCGGGAADVVSIAPDDVIYVLGDSLSTDVPRGGRTWPAILAVDYGYNVVNLAVAGAVISEGLQQAQGIRHESAVVFIELGGNDMLSGSAPEPFEKHLRMLVEHLRGGRHRVIMFELPSLPLSQGNRIVRVQRKIAKQYGLVLLPRKLIAEVLAMPDGTTDGIHFSLRGHEHMASMVSRYLRKNNP